MPDTNILLTPFLSDEGVAEVSDFMPVLEKGHVHPLIRRAKTVRGEVHFRMRCEPKFDYGHAGHHIEQRSGEVRIEDSAVVAEFTLGLLETASFPSSTPVPMRARSRPRALTSRRRA